MGANVTPMMRKPLMAGCLVTASLLLGVGPGHAGSPTTTPNLIQNPGGESSVGSSDGNPVAAPKWTSKPKGLFTPVKYGAGSIFPTSSTPGPPSRGKNFFAGGPFLTQPTVTASQSISLAAYATAIGKGSVKYTVSGWFGGATDQDDNAKLSVTFKSATGATVGTSGSIGGFKAANRGNITKLLPATKAGAVPKTARTAVVTLTMQWAQGIYIDAYCDNLSLVLSGT